MVNSLTPLRVLVVKAKIANTEQPVRCVFLLLLLCADSVRECVACLAPHRLHAAEEAVTARQHSQHFQPLKLSLSLQVLTRAMRAGADSLQGWQLLCQLQLQNEQYDLAAESAAMGLKCLHQRRSRGYRSQPAVAAAIVLTRGYSLLAGGRPDEALVLFTALTGRKKGKDYTSAFVS